MVAYDRRWMRYLVQGREVAPTTGKQHFQSHVYTCEKLSVKAVRAKLAPHHVEVSVAPLKSIEYCKKDGDFKEDGVPPQQGARTDLVDAVQKIRSGDLDYNEVVLHDPMLFHQYGRTLQAAFDRVLATKTRNFMPQCYWLYGPTGVGKTRAVHDAESSIYWFPYENAGWWDSYEGQEAVIFDDFRGQLPLNVLLRICDRYDYRVPRRNRIPIPLLAKRIYFTSCKTPEQVYDKEGTNGDSVAQLLRRVDVRFVDGLEKPLFNHQLPSIE